MTDREREARIRGRKVLDREEFDEAVEDYALFREGMPTGDEYALDRLLAHDAAQRAEIERYRGALEEIVDEWERGRRWPGAFMYRIAHRALNEGADDE